MPAATHVREESDAGFRHGEAGALGGHAVARRQRKPDAAAHGHPVHQRHDRLRVDLQQVVQPVLGVEEAERARPALRGAVRQEADVAPGTEPSAHMVNHHPLDVRVFAPFEQRRGHLLAHAERQGAERLRPVQRQPANRAFAADEEFGLRHQSVSQVAS
jgi:hypothetical protein